VSDRESGASRVDPLAADEGDRGTALAREWDRLVEQVRALDGFGDFLRPPALETLLPAARGGPVVIVNVSRWRCDALIVTSTGVRTRPLQQLTLGDAVARTRSYLSQLAAGEQAAGELIAVEDELDDRRPASIRAVRRATEAVMAANIATDAMLRETQAWMWDAIAEPVLDALGLHEAVDGAWPRIWWCPTGPLTLLPLHSAGRHEDRSRTVLDRAISSYTPTVRALLEAQRERTDARAGLLLVTAEETPDRPRLRAVARERAGLEALVPADRRTVLDGPAATREAVDRELSRHGWVHFSCHGDQYLGDPSLGGVVLHDRMLTVADIAARRFRGHFAGLSACKTAVGGMGLLDEAVTLGAALHHAGYRHVVASLWSIDDDVGADVFAAVYADLVREGVLDPTDAAAALHRAVRLIRDDAPDQPRLWAPFTHTGP
jgi:CHAT domain-containing protein